MLANGATMTLGCGGGTVSFPNDRITEVLDAFFDGRRLEAARLGRAHLATSGAAVRTIIAPVLDTIDAHGAKIGASLRALDAKIDAEFQASESVLVAGWVLAPTEAAVCTLAAHTLDFPDEELTKEPRG